MKRSVLVTGALVVIIVLALVSVLYFIQVKQVAGNVNSDTTWSGVISLKENVTVVDGATLTIKPGTTVNLGSSTIQIDGTLVAKGNFFQRIALNGGRIIFTANSTPWNMQAGSGSIIENCQATTEIIIHEASPKIISCTLNRPQPHSISPTILLIYGGSPIISNNIFDGHVLRVSRFEGGGSGIVFVTASNATVNGNTVKNCVIGVDVYSGQYQTHNQQPIDSVHSNLTIQNNLIYSNKGQGVYFGAPIKTVFKDNTLTENVEAIWVTGFSNQSEVTGNNIYGNSNSSITMMYRSSWPTDMNIPNNWWGTTDTQKIAQSIYDSRTNSLVGTVTFTPILTAPNQNAPKV